MNPNVEVRNRGPAPATLADVGRGQSARVEAVDLPPLDRERLRALGLAEGALVVVVRGGDPCLVSIENPLGRPVRLGLRRSEAARIRVEAEARVTRRREADGGAA